MVPQGQAINSAARPAKARPASTRCWRCSFMYLMDGVGKRLTISTEVMAMKMPDTQGSRTNGSLNWNEISNGSSIMQAAAGVGRLLLTHVPAWVDPQTQLSAARTTFPDSELVQPGAGYEV